MPQYLIAFNDEWVPPHTPEEIHEKSVRVEAVSAEMKAAGILLFENGGIDADSVVCSVEAKDGKPVFSDGPYIETKEHLGGFWVVELPDLDAALELAARASEACMGAVEVRPFQDEPEA